jgi:hypothetical protein
VEGTHCQPFHKRTLLFPRAEVLALCPRIADVTALPSLRGSVPARLLARYMNALALESPQLEPAAAKAAANAALELLRAAIEPHLPTGRAAVRAAMRAEIARYVRTHLQDRGSVRRRSRERMRCGPLLAGVQARIRRDADRGTPRGAGD